MRIREIQTRKGPLNTLLQRGVVGDEIWQRLLRAEQELEAELKDVVAEANALATGWGATIFQTANEIVVNRMTRAKIEEKRQTLGEEKLAWEKVREASRLELEGETSKPRTERKQSTTGMGTSTSTSETTLEKAVPRAAVVTEGSDEDAVMVEKEAGAAEVTTPDAGTSTGGGGGKKKKKGKK